MNASAFEILFACFAFIFGAAIGSFLNVCIYRMPRDLQVNKPARSFCPSCNYQIPWFHNIPLFSWLFLRGQCGNCAARISVRYFGVELLTGLLFLAIWLRLGSSFWYVALPLFVLISLLVVATFIDFEHYIIPDEITIGGAVAGVVAATLAPSLMGVPTILRETLAALPAALVGLPLFLFLEKKGRSADGKKRALYFALGTIVGVGAAAGILVALQARLALQGLTWSLVGALLGFFLLWSVVELGKMAFGRKRLTYPKPEPMTWTRKGEDAELAVADDKMLWSDFFVRGNEQLLMSCPKFSAGGETFENVQIRWTLDWLHLGERKWRLDESDTFSGVVTEVTLPREAMGFGDVKFMGAIGAFLGWQAVLFTIVGASVAGALVGGLTIALGKREWSAKIPFGPYLALGALVWIFAGPEIIAWYLRFAMPVES